jgi:hypothetical protein
MTVGAAPAGTGVAIIGAEALVGAARSDGTVGIDRFTGPELIAQAATARVSTVQAATARVSTVQAAIARVSIVQAAIARVSIVQAAIARVSTVQAAIAREVVARQVVARETADDRSPLVLAFAFCRWPRCIFCSAQKGKLEGGRRLNGPAAFPPIH